MKAIRTVFRIVILLFAVWIALFVGFTAFVFDLKPQYPDLKTSAIVVLTGGKDRIETGLQLFSEGLSDTLYITGVNPITTKDEILAKWSGPEALPDCCIEIGQEATSTYENALELKNWAAGKNLESIRLVTSDYHMLRAFTEIKQVFPDLVITKHPVPSYDTHIWEPRLWLILFSEFNKTVIRALQITYTNIFG